MLCNAMHVTLCYDRTRQGMVRRTARGYGNGSRKKAGRKGKEAKYTTSTRHRFKETERKETRGEVRGERACRPIRGSRRHATCDMRCAMFLVALDPLDPAGPFRATLVRQDPSTRRPFDLVFHSISLTGLMDNESNATVVTYGTVPYYTQSGMWKPGSGIQSPKPP